MADPNRFSLPIIEFLLQLMREQYPGLNLSRGSAFYQSNVLPFSLMLQPFRDRMNTIKRNQSLLNYQVMSDQEVDRRASNFLIGRKTGTRAYGIQRVFYEDLQSVFIDRNVVFFDDQDHRWNPISGIVMTEVEMASQLIPETSEYYVDVGIIAEAEGEEYVAEEGQINQFANIPNATRTLNPVRLAGGKGQETNTELVVRTETAITNRDLVKNDAIETAISEAFISVRNVKSIGYGDEDMERDIVEAVVSIDEILPFSFCQKVNLPLDENGEVNWFDSAGNPVISPIGGYVGAVVDLTGLDFNEIPLSSSASVTTYVSVQPGFRIRVFTAYNGDPDGGDYTVSRVDEVPIVPNGSLVKVCRLDKPFGDPQIASWDPVADFDKYSYSVLGSVTTKHFHVGGKIDVFVDSTADEETTVIVNVLPETAPGFVELPVTEANPTNPDTGLPLYENGQTFRIPMLSVLRVDQVDFEDDNVIERELISDVNYTFVTAESRGRFTQADNDVIIIKGFEDDGVTAAFTGRRIKIAYLTNPDIPLIQEFVNSGDQRDLTKDTLVKPKDTVILDVELTYEGDPGEEEVQQIVEEYIRSTGFGAAVTVHDIGTLLAMFGVEKINYPVQLRLRRSLGNGITESEFSEDSLTVGDVEVFFPNSPLSITKAS